MEQSFKSDGVRWALVPFAAFFGFFISLVLALPVNWMIHQIMWSLGNAMPGKMYLLYSWGFDGALAASLVIQFGTYTAPTHKRVTSLCLLVVGALIAWMLVGDFYLPMHSFHNETTRTWWPIIGTYLGGAITCAWVWFVTRRSK